MRSRFLRGRYQWIFDLGSEAFRQTPYAQVQGTVKLSDHLVPVKTLKGNRRKMATVVIHLSSQDVKFHPLGIYYRY